MINKFTFAGSSIIGVHLITSSVWKRREIYFQYGSLISRLTEALIYIVITPEYVFRLEENVSRFVVQDSQTPYGNNKIQLARDQVVLIETAANLWARQLQANDFFAFFFLVLSLEIYSKTLKWLVPRGTVSFVPPRLSIMFTKGNTEVKVTSRGQHWGHCLPWGQSLSAYCKCH